MTRTRGLAAMKKAVNKKAAKKKAVLKNPVKRAGAACDSDGLEGVSFYLGRAYYRYIALVEACLEEAGRAGSRAARDGARALYPLRKG